MKRDFAALVAEPLIEQLEQGTAPLLRLWRPGERFMPYNPITGRNYRGINAIWLMLAGGAYADLRWLTYSQVRSLGGQIRRGETGTVVQYWKWREERPLLDEQGQPVRDEKGEPLKAVTELEHPRVYSAVVFNAEQADGLHPPPERYPLPEWDRHEVARQILSGLGASIRHVAGNRACYDPKIDSMTLPERGRFATADAYYAIALQQCIHATGHQHRLARDLAHPLGSPGYAREELRTGIASMILGEDLGIGYDPRHQAAYVGHWIKILQEDPLELFRAASDAEGIVQFLRLAPELRAVRGGTAIDTAANVDRHAREDGSQNHARERIHIAVPYSERHVAKQVGAKWDQEARSWYIPKGAPLAPLSRWPQQKAHRSGHEPAGDPHREFGEALRAAGLRIDGLPQMDGRLHRVPVDGDKRGQKSGAYAGFLDGVPGGWMQNFRTGAKRNWTVRVGGTPLTTEERMRLQLEAELRRQRREARWRAIHDETIDLLIPKLRDLAPSTPDHPYLQKKGVGRHGDGIGVNDAGPLKIHGGEDIPQLWSAKGDLIIPIHTIDGTLVGAQTIDAHGRKIFPRGCSWRGGMYWLTGELPGKARSDVILIAEGYSTAATLHERTGYPVATAFAAGNLEPVVQACRQRYPFAKIVVAGDNDHTEDHELDARGQPKKNVGREKAEQATAAVGGGVASPPFARHEPGSDWNDLAQMNTVEEWKQLWTLAFDNASRQIARAAGMTVTSSDRRQNGFNPNPPLRYGRRSARR